MGRLVCCLLLVAAVSACRPRESGDVGWDRFAGEYVEGYFRAWPETAVWAGRHEFDGRVTDWDDAALAREADRLRRLRERALAFDPGGLDADRRLERDALVAHVDAELFWLVRADAPHRNPTCYASSLEPDVYVTRPYAPLGDRMRAFVAWARNVPAVTQRMRTNLRTPLPATFVERGASLASGLADSLGTDVAATFASVRDDSFATANAGAIAALRDLAAWFAAERPRATGDFALGADRFREMLWATERIDVPLDRLERLGRADLERNRTALRTACARVAPGASLAACTARVRARKPADGPLDAARRQLVLLRDFVVRHDLVDIPSDEQALVAESPPYMRWNAAYIQIPGPYEHGLPATYYIAPPDPKWSPAERADYVPSEASLLFISAHEVFPGHFVQFLHANRVRSPFGRIFKTTAYTEGWAHYAEELVWEAGLGDGDPALHVGQLVMALQRDARFLAAIGLHAGGMSVADAERLFRDDALQDAGNARQQAARGTYDPAYLAYTVGKLMIRRLRDDWSAPRGGRTAWRAFHDAFLGYGGPPVPLVRAAMLGPDAGPPL
jgi:uncharacterized protein (DUF885 family)